MPVWLNMDATRKIRAVAMAVIRAPAGVKLKNLNA